MTSDRVPVDLVAGFTDPGSTGTYLYARCVLCRHTLTEDYDSPAELSLERVIRLAQEHYAVCTYLTP